MKLDEKATVKKASYGALAFDCNFRLTKKKATEFYNNGYRCAIRYVPRTAVAKSHRHDLNTAEIKIILKAKLGLMVVQHYYWGNNPSRWPSKELGGKYGGYAAQYSKKQGVLEGTNLWLDLEAIPKGVEHKDIMEYCQAWYKEVKEGGYRPGIYVGYNSRLNDKELYYNLSFKHYWRSQSRYGVSIPKPRGYQMYQGLPVTINKNEFDPNMIGEDAKGGRPYWMIDKSNMKKKKKKKKNKGKN